MKTLTIVNMKGGCCKTTTTRNVGYVLAAKFQKRVLLVDLDSSGNLSNSFSLRPNKAELRGTSAVLMNSNANPESEIVPTRVDRLFLLPGNNTLGMAEISIKMDSVKPQQFHLKKQLDKVSHLFDYCLIDCPPTTENSVLVVNALTASTEVILPTVPNSDAIDGVGFILDMIENVSEYNPRLRARGVLLCRITRDSFSQQLLDHQFVIPRFKTYIRNSVSAEYSLVEGLSITEYDPKCNPAIDYDHLTEELIGEELPHIKI